MLLKLLFKTLSRCNMFSKTYKSVVRDRYIAKLQWTRLEKQVIPLILISTIMRPRRVSEVPSACGRNQNWGAREGFVQFESRNKACSTSENVFLEL